MLSCEILTDCVHQTLDALLLELVRGTLFGTYQGKRCFADPTPGKLLQPIAHD
jgi:hypothetical protein